MTVDISFILFSRVLLSFSGMETEDILLIFVKVSIGLLTYARLCVATSEALSARVRVGVPVLLR